MTTEKICVFGLWHLGSVVSACLANFGYHVSGYDKDENKVKSLQTGKAVIEEPGLDDLLSENIKKGRLSFSFSIENAIENCSIGILTVDTPLDEEDNIDLTEVFETIKQIAKLVKRDFFLIVQSQVPVGTCEKILTIMQETNPSQKFEIACVPENLRLGNALSIFEHPDRIIIGSNDPKTIDKVEKFFSVINAPMIKMDLKSAEMSKHAINAFLANCISFINEIGNLSEEVGADAVKVSESLTTESRIGNKLPLRPGLGFAGGTLARDIKILSDLGRKHSMTTNMIDAILKTNHEQNMIALKKLKKLFVNLRDIRVGILGLTYKAGTNTLRRSSSIEIISKLLDENAIIKAFDPSITELHLFDGKKFTLVTNTNEIARDSDAILILTDWPEFKKINFNEIRNLMKNPIILDMKNMLDPTHMKKIGFNYIGVGRT